MTDTTTTTPGQKPKRRFTTEKEILELISTAEKKVKDMTVEAELMDRFADVLREYEGFTGTKNILTLKGYRDLAQRHRDTSIPYQQNKLRKLGDALAQIRNGIFPEIIDDTSVPRNV